MYTYSQGKLFNESRKAIRLIYDGAMYQLEALHRRPNGELDDTYKAAHDELIAHILEEVESFNKYSELEDA